MGRCSSNLPELFGKPEVTEITVNERMDTIDQIDFAEANTLRIPHRFSRNSRNLGYGQLPEDSSGLNDARLPDYNDKPSKRALRKIDLKLLPLLGVLWQFSFMDRSLMANGKMGERQTALGFSDWQWKWVMVASILSGAVFGVPSMIMLKRFRPRFWLAGLVVGWGTLMALQGVWKKRGSYIVIRTFMGIFEAGILPGVVYLLSRFYCRFELQRRLSWIFALACIWEALMVMMGMGSRKMDGHLGPFAGWQFMTISMGAGLALTAVALVFMLPDSLDRMKKLTSDQKTLIQRRLLQDSGTATGRVDLADEFHGWQSIRDLLLNWKLWLAVLIFQCCTLVMCFLSFAIIPMLFVVFRGDVPKASMLVIPVWIVGIIATLLCSWLSDKRQVRWIFVAIGFHMAAIAFLLLAVMPSKMNSWFVYVVIMVIPAGVFPAFVTTIAWTMNNLASTWRRAIGIAMLTSFGNIGGAFGYHVLFVSELPVYFTGYCACFGACVLGFCASLVLRHGYLQANRTRDGMSQEQLKEQFSDTQLLAMGDRSPLWRYVV